MMDGIRLIIGRIAKKASCIIDADYKINRDDCCLIVAPHPDDESIACGGLLSLYGPQTDVLLITDGGAGNPEWTYEHTAEVRLAEFTNTMKMANVRKFYALGCRCDCYSRLKKKRIELDLSTYTHIFIPNRNENHPEHKIVNILMCKVLKHQRSRAKVFEYEVWTPILEPTHYLDIADVVEQKKQLIRNYRCQLKHIDYETGAIGLNSYRAIQCGKKYAEAYKMILPSKERISKSFNVFLYKSFLVLHPIIKRLSRKNET